MAIVLVCQRLEERTTEKERKVGSDSRQTDEQLGLQDAKRWLMGSERERLCESSPSPAAGGMSNRGPAKLRCVYVDPMAACERSRVNSVWSNCSRLSESLKLTSHGQIHYVAKASCTLFSSPATLTW